jgi:hypothetical protein
VFGKNLNKFYDYPLWSIFNTSLTNQQYRGFTEDLVDIFLKARNGELSVEGSFSDVVTFLAHSTDLDKILANGGNKVNQLSPYDIYMLFNCLLEYQSIFWDLIGPAAARERTIKILSLIGENIDKVDQKEMIPLIHHLRDERILLFLAQHYHSDSPWFVYTLLGNAIEQDASDSSGIGMRVADALGADRVRKIDDYLVRLLYWHTIHKALPILLKYFGNDYIKELMKERNISLNGLERYGLTEHLIYRNYFPL